ncbi:MAG TPA: DUF2461 domain-containing protein [Bacteroidales bacterium]|mgnify:CR=1 FL=1|nr:DUF2461 domain-containing protein [Bacteroidales bacterium]HOK74678.1 DUF2461 domain-containing protein [Bacteroidales bacterium]HOM39651.1 DUF2461 domain-containing protein [Bacteroidales bacterium]HOU30644.1 DUF2461 domain-containing protein [Bacteroidales bacterium]HPP91601.1 DUF2461 domain-containing protein [Bacteroidales bacterium]
MVAIQKNTVEFLKALALNNNRDWFEAHRVNYETSRKNFEAFVQAFIDRITEFDPVLKGLEAKSCIFRINRDIRFSNDKSPYKTNFGALIIRGGRKNIHRFAGYYIHLEPGEYMIAGGAYLPPPEWLAAIREKIAEKPEEFLKIIENKDFKKYFGELDDEKLKSAPRGFSPDHPYIELLKFKSYTVVNYISEKKVLSPDYLDYAVKVAEVLKPFNDFFNECAV